MPNYSIAEALVDYLVTQSLGTKGTSLFGDHLPATPDEATALYERPGASPGETFGAGTLPNEVHYRIQAMTRSASYQGGMDTAKNIWRKLAALSDYALVTASATIYRIQAIDVPVYVDQDQNDRFMWSANYEVHLDKLI